MSDMEPRSRKTRAAIAVLVVGVVAFAFYARARVASMRDLRCEAYAEPRANALCCALQRELRWGWWGHAILAPAFKVSVKTSVIVFCDEHVTLEDVPVLKRMHNHASEGRVSGGTHDLLEILGKNEVANTASILNPTHEMYVLRDGCP